MSQKLESLQANYPSAAEKLQDIPIHIAENIGDAALELSHIDLHLLKTSVNDRGEAVTRRDTGKKITDPEYDISELDAETIEAARAGKEKLATLLSDTSGFIKAAYTILAERGHRLLDPETADDEAHSRERLHEKDRVYGLAAELAANAALEAQDSSSRNEAIESLLVLIYKGPFDKRNTAIRDLVQAGLGKDIYSAILNSKKIFLGKNESYFLARASIGGQYRALQLIELVLGKQLDKDFNQSDPIMLENIKRETGELEKTLDLLAVAMSDNSHISLDQAIKLLPPQYSTKLERRLATTSPDELDDLFYALNRSGNWSNFEKILRIDNPRQAIEITERLGIDLWQVESLFSSKSENGDLILDPKQVEGIGLIIQNYPQYFGIIQRNLLGRRGAYDSRAILEGITTLERNGFNVEELIDNNNFISDPARYADTSVQIASSLRAANIDPKSLSQLVVYSGYFDVYGFIRSAMWAENPQKTIENFISTAETGKHYYELYSNAVYPIGKEHELDKVLLENLPIMQSRLQKLGIPSDLAEAIFESWATYDAYYVHYYNRENEYKLPLEKPEDKDILAIAHKQTEALESQMDRLERYVARYGTDECLELIENFGIYNFSRYTIEELHEQNEGWKAGLPVKNVIVNARSDWNSFTGKDVTFEGDQGLGVVRFEVNTAPDIGKVAIKIGKYEREHGREPNITRFIVHAHGSPDSMVIGVHGERLNNETYLNAALSQQRLPNTRTNDFRKHLGDNFEVILQSCSTAGETESKNLSQLMSEHHRISKLSASDVTITGLTIKPDGEVKFSVREGDGEPVVYVNNV